MPANANNKSANQRFTAWLNQGLKRQNWSARRVAQMGLLIALGVVVAALYLVQSSQIVTSTRQVQQLREELAELQQANADLGDEDQYHDHARAAAAARRNAGLCLHRQPAGLSPCRICPRTIRRRSKTSMSRALVASRRYPAESRRWTHFAAVLTSS